MNSEDGYRLLAGKCRQICEAIANIDPEWRLVRGYYYCPIWGQRTHWWLVSKDGIIYDPTVAQFPNPEGEYVEFDGLIACEECGKEMKESDIIAEKDGMHFDGHHAFCSGRCHARCVGLEEFYVQDN